MDLIFKNLKSDRKPINKMSSLSNCWELLYHIEKENIKSKQDVLVLMVHLTFIKNDFLCIHEEDADQKPIELSELLPTGWNSEGNNYRIRYYNNGVRYHFGANLVDDMVALNLINLQDQTTHTLVIKVTNEVKETEGSLAEMVPNHKELFCKFWTDIVKPAAGEGQRDTHAQTEQQSRATARDPLSEEPRFRPTVPVNPVYPERFDPLNVGARDLHPIPMAPVGGIGGGMLMEIPRPRIPAPDDDFPGFGRLPRGSIPPGARYDPIHPGLPGRLPGRRGGPDPDHLPMPGGSFNDHMFM